MSTPEEIIQMFEDIDSNAEELSEYEEATVNDLRHWFDTHGQTLTTRQDDLLETIWDRVTS